jgi:hypothetical protein
MKNSSDTIGNRSRDLPVCSAVAQPLRHRAVVEQCTLFNKASRNVYVWNDEPVSSRVVNLYVDKLLTYAPSVLFSRRKPQAT